ncbi:MAG: nucleotidyltransferase domain-containing protein [Ignavibacteriaceae bacterium]|nr:nucleotidyltransferase domain-containing protein [Ignavibacteriaceae bacterium]
MKNIDILIENKLLEEFCEANGIKKLSLFGSYLKNTYNEESDVDLLVEFEDETEYGLLDVARIERELSEMIGKKVDLRTSEELSRFFRDTVVKEAVVKYGR